MIPLVACIYNYLKLSLQHSKTMFNVFTTVHVCSTTFHCERQEGWSKGDDTKCSRWTQVALAYVDKIYKKSWTCEKWLKECLSIGWKLNPKKNLCLWIPNWQILQYNFSWFTNLSMKGKLFVCYVEISQFTTPLAMS